MADEGYLIGYEDVNGNFVQIGQFNNAADDVTKPLVLRHTNSGETLELDGSSFRPSTQIGDTNNRPDVFANTVDLNSLVGAGLDTKADLTQSGGVLVASQLPDLAITNIDVVADQTARLALNAEEGDVAIQTDISETFILSTNDPTVNSNWKKVQLDVLGAIDGQTITPAQTGTSTNPTDVEAGNIEAGTIGSSGSRPDLLADRVSISEVATKSHQTSDQTIPSGTRTTIDIDSTAFEDTDVVTADFANNQVVIQEDGIYVIDGRVQLRSSSNWSTGDSFKIIISLNGSIKSVIDGRKAGTDRQGMNIRDTVNASSGDSIRLKISQDSGGSVDTIGLLDHTRLIISRVG